MIDPEAADPLLVETVERLLADVCTPEEVETSERAGWSQRTWTALADAGFPWVGIDEPVGSGGTLHDVAAILRAVGRFAAPVPVAETAVLGGWVLAEAGLELPAGPVTVLDAPVARVVEGRLLIDGIAAWGRYADRVVVVAETGDAFSIRPDQVELTPGANMAGEARDRIVGNVPIGDVEHGPFDPGAGALAERGTLSRAILAAGALSAVSQMTIDYTNQRRQFGQPVSRFQAVQQHLVTVAQCAARASMAADVAVRAAARGAVGIEIAVARVVVDDAIAAGTRAAHQAHGAIGMTREYPLHQYTRRLWSWRQEWGTTRWWRRRLGAQVVSAGADGLFGLVTA